MPFFTARLNLSRYNVLDNRKVTNMSQNGINVAFSLAFACETLRLYSGGLITMDKSHSEAPENCPLDYLLYALILGVFAAISYTFILWLKF
jgi:hypothetical protein